MNRVTLIGRVATDMEVRTAGESKVIVFNLAVPRSKEKTDFIHCKVWDKQADVVEKYVNKGDKLALNGSIQVGSYTDRKGVKSTSFIVNVNNVELIQPKSEEIFSTPEVNEGLPFN